MPWGPDPTLNSVASAPSPWEALPKYCPDRYCMGYCYTEHFFPRQPGVVGLRLQANGGINLNVNTTNSQELIRELIHIKVINRSGLGDSLRKGFPWKKLRDTPLGWCVCLRLFQTGRPASVRWAGDGILCALDAGRLDGLSDICAEKPRMRGCGLRVCGSSSAERGTGHGGREVTPTGGTRGCFPWARCGP